MHAHWGLRGKMSLSALLHELILAGKKLECARQLLGLFPAVIATPGALDVTV